MHVVVLGAGITGLATAHQLLKAGCSVTVYEAAASDGGLGGTFRTDDGFAFDFGPHEFVTENPALVSWLADVCGDDLLEIEKRTAQHFNGRFVRYPFEVVDVLRNISPMLTARVLAEVGWRRVRGLFASPSGGDFESWTIGRFGPSLYRSYFEPYTRKVWGIAPRELDESTASDRITVDSLWDLIKKTLRYDLLGAEDFKRRHSEYRHGFRYVRGGIGNLVRHVRRAVERAGGELRFGHRVDAIDVADGRVQALSFADGAGRVDAFDAVVSTIPLPTLVSMTLGNDATPLLQANTLPFRGMAFVFLRVDRPQVTDYHWVYFPDADVPFQRVTEFGHFDAGMTPPGRTGMTLEVAMNPDEPGWQDDDDAIARSCVRSLERLGLLDESAVLGWNVVRTRYAYPLQVRGFAERSANLLDALASRADNLVSIGRQGLFRYCNMNECMEMALDVAPRILAGEDGLRYTAASAWRGVLHTDRYE